MVINYWYGKIENMIHKFNKRIKYLIYKLIY